MDEEGIRVCCTVSSPCDHPEPFDDELERVDREHYLSTNAERNKEQWSQRIEYGEGDERDEEEDKDDRGQSVAKGM